MVELIRQALSKGTKVYWSIACGKDGEAGSHVTHNWG